MRVVAALDRLEQSEQIRQVLLGLGLECGANDCVPYSELAVRLAQGGADLVLVHIGTGSEEALQSIRQAITLASGPVLAVGPMTDAQQVAQAQRSGARQYLDERHLRPELEGALENLRLAGAVRHGQGRVVGVASATPGSGVTTIATNLAFSWGSKYPDRVALLELGRTASELALCLDLRPRHTIDDVAQNWERMDAALLRQSMMAHPAGVQVLPHAPTALSTAPINPQAVRKALILMRTMYAGAVLDLGHMLDIEHFEAMRLCDTVVVVVRLDIPSLRQTRHLLQVLAEQGIPVERVRVVANRYGQRGQLAWKKAEEALGTPFAAYIPDDSGKMNQALNQGLPVVQVSRLSGIARSFKKLADSLNGKS